MPLTCQSSQGRLRGLTNPPTPLLPIDLTTPLIPRGPSILRPSSTPVIGWECCYGGKLKYPGIIIKGLPVANKSNFNFIRKLIIRIMQIQRGYHPCIVQDVTIPSQPHDATHELGLLSMRCQQPHAAPHPITHPNHHQGD